MSFLIELFKSIDPNILTLTIGFTGAYFSVHFSLFEQVGDLEKIKKISVYSIYQEELAKGNQFEGIEFIDFLYKKSKVLVLPAQRNDKHFKNAFKSYFITAVITIFYDYLLNLIEFLPNKGYILFIYSATFGIACSFLYYKVIFFRHFYRLQKKYINNFEVLDDFKIEFDTVKRSTTTNNTV